MILKWKLSDVFGYALDSSGSDKNLVVGCCEHGIETLGYMKDGEFLDSLSY